MASFESIVTNKWFVIALITALIVVIFLYSQKTCYVEQIQPMIPTNKKEKCKSKNRKKEMYHEYDYDDCDIPMMAKQKYPKQLDIKDLNQFCICNQV